MAPTVPQPGGSPRSSGRLLDRGRSLAPEPARVPRPRDPLVLDALLQRAQADQRARPRAARVLADVIDRLLDERLAATGSDPLVR